MKAQLAIPDTLYEVVRKHKRISLHHKLSFEDYTIVAWLLLLHMDGRCPDAEAAAALAPDSFKALAIFRKVLRGETMYYGPRAVSKS